MTVRAYLLRRVLLLVFVLIGISLITFLLARVVPADPAALYAGPQARGPAIAAARKLLHMDQPLYVQYGAYIWDLLHGNWGTSLRTHRAVLGDILQVRAAVAAAGRRRPWRWPRWWASPWGR